VSKLLIVARTCDRPLEFSLKSATHATTITISNGSLTNVESVAVKGGIGTLSSLVRESSNITTATDTSLVNPQKDKTGKSVVVAVYTRLAYVNVPVNTNHTTIQVQVTDIGLMR
jgi:hypothetical protein